MADVDSNNAKLLSRREALYKSACGFGGMALSTMLASSAAGNTLDPDKRRQDPFAALKSNYTPRAQSVIFLYMDGGPSQVDTFDPKPQLQRDDGKPFPMKMEKTQFWIN